MTTAATIIANAYTEIGVLGQGETIQTNDQTWGLTKLNMLLGEWATRGMLALNRSHAQYTFGTSKQSYTIGTSGTPDFSATRPVRIEHANLVIVASGNVRRQLEILNVDEYAELNLPAQSSELPTHLYYQPTVPNGTLWPWPYPTTTTNKLELFTWNQITSFAAVSTDKDLAPGYEQALTLDLARALAPSVGRSFDGMLAENHRRAMYSIQKANLYTPKLKTDAPSGDRTRWNHTRFITGGFV